MSSSQQDLITRPADAPLDNVVTDGEPMSASSSPNPGEITKTLKRALATGHLLSPATACPNLPLGCEVAFSLVKVDQQRETYQIAGSAKRGVNKTALNRIAKAIGVNWDSRLSHRLDDGQDSCFAAYKAVGHYRDFDGTWRTIEGTKQMDLRDGSERARNMKVGELSESRKFIAEHAETKAKLRAIRSIGIETSYEQSFFDEPFICARLVFTGRSTDPQIQAMFAQETARAMLGGTEALYGNRAALPPMQMGADPEPSAAASAEGAAGEPVTGRTEGAGSVTGAPQGQETPKTVIWTVPFGKFAGVAIDQVPEDRLSGLLDYVEMSLQDGANAGRADELNAWKTFILADIDRRKGEKGTVKY